MQITRKSPISGIVRTLDLPITIDQYDNWESGTPVQHAFPALSPGQREFIMTGISDEEWDEMFGDESDGEEGEDNDMGDVDEELGNNGEELLKDNINEDKYDR